MSNSRRDVVEAAGRLFAERGYHGTSMRDLGRELGLNGSSLYAHVDSKEDLLVDVVERGAELFSEAASDALATSDDPVRQLHALIAGHVRVVLGHRNVARTFLNEARSLDTEHRSKIVGARNRYEEAFRRVIRSGVDEGVFAAPFGIEVAAIFVLSILNAVERWFAADGALDEKGLVDAVHAFALDGLRAPPIS